jgi:DNA-binding NarL/FixJ family response regulator
MVLSVRTVESHVFSACHKVGADGREGLARVARTWLTCTPP